MSTVSNYSGTGAYVCKKNGVNARTVTAGAYAPSPVPYQSDLVYSYDPANPSSYSGSGTAMYDISPGTSYDLTMAGGMESSYIQPGVFELDGVNDYAYASTPPQVTGDFSLACWVKFDTAPTLANTIFFGNFYLLGNSIQGLRFNGVAGRFEWMHVDTSGNLTTSRLNSVPLSTGTWYLITAAWDESLTGVQVRAYDSTGLLQSRSQTKASTTNSVAMPFAFPFYGSVSVNYTEARVGEAAMWRAAVDSNGMDAFYNATKERYA